MAKLMTVKEVAEYLKINKRTVYRLLQHNTIPAARIGHQWRFDKETIDDWINQLSSSSRNIKKTTILIIDEIHHFNRSQQDAISDFLAGEYSSINDGVVSYTDLNVDYFTPSPRAKVPRLAVSRRTVDFSEVSLGLPKAEAMAEANRCFQCGLCTRCENCYIFCPEPAITFSDETLCFTINYDICKRCGICIEECPHNAITWEGEAA